MLFYNFIVYLSAAACKRTSVVEVPQFGSKPDWSHTEAVKSPRASISYGILPADSNFLPSKGGVHALPRPVFDKYIRAYYENEKM